MGSVLLHRQDRALHVDTGVVPRNLHFKDLEYLNTFEAELRH